MKVLLATLHAKYVHSSLALPCLAAACRDIPGAAMEIREFTVNEPHDQTLRSLVKAEADVVAFSCYIWNMEQTLRLAADLKKVRPDTWIVLGGPEASFGVCEMMEQNRAVDCTIRGEGEESFRELVTQLVQTGGRPEAMQGLTEGITFRSDEDLIVLPERHAIADLDTIPSPFAAGLADLSKPLVYFESSRGCPFSCAYCMSSLEKGVRSFSLPRIEEDLRILMEARVGTVKFVDRTFNYDAARANRIWEHILRHNIDSSYHFEIAADLLTDDNIALLRDVPAGVFRFEIGVQSENPATLKRVGRASNLPRLFANVARLREETGVVLHLDLVAGLPHEDLAGFLGSLQSLFLARPHHIQVEPLKVLKGAPMRRIAAEEEYAFSDAPPYKILHTPWLSFGEISRVETISRLVDLYYNSGKFAATLASVALRTPLAEFFSGLAAFWEGEGITAGLSQDTLFEIMHRYLKRAGSAEEVDQWEEALRYDYCSAGYPVPGRLPLVPEPTPGQVPRERIDGLIRGCAIPVGSKIRWFVAEFSRDYRQAPYMERPIRLLFLYISAPGRKMETRTLQL